jgi:phosphohistidine phosphatase
MKTLYIARHAKSSWDDLRVSDHDRGLLPVGKKRTKKIARWLNEHDILPDRIISSTAVRAYKTARLLAQGMGFPKKKIEKEASFYNANPEDIMEYLYALPNTVDKVMVVGHNPTFTELVNLFLEENKWIDNLPTSGVAAIRFETDKWNELDLAKQQVEFLITPKMVKEEEDLG